MTQSETFAIIGYGSIGKRHAENLRSLRPLARLLLVDPLRSRGVNYASTEALLLEHTHLSGALICSPHDAHLDALERLTAAGVPVYLEKPVCSVVQYRNGKTYQQIERVALRSGRIGMGFQYRYHALIEPLYAERHAIRRLDFQACDNLIDRYGPTVLETMASHSIDLALWLLGPAYAVRLHTNGRRVQGHILHSNGTESRYFIEMDSGPRASVITATRGRNRQWLTIDADPWMYQRCLNDWLRWIMDGQRSERLATLRDGLAVQDALGKVSIVKKSKALEEMI